MGVTASPKRIKGAPAAALPDELVEEVLARLPVKSLRRFQCVSRSWDDLITSPAFHQLHSERARHGNPKLLLRPPRMLSPLYYAWQVGGAQRSAVTKILDDSGCYFPQDHVFPICSKHCHGLVLLRCIRYGMHYVWNPSTGEVVSLPDRTPFWAACCKPRPFISYGLCYCSATGKHKVVRMYHLDARATATTVCEVFTLDESTHWRPAATAPPVVRLRRNGRQGAVLCNGNLHFVGEDGTITTFSVTDEAFGVLMPPQEIRDCHFELTEIDGCLCIYFGNGCDLQPQCPYTIWLLRGQGKWEKLCCIDWGAVTQVELASLRSEWIAPLGIHRAGSGSNQPKKIMFGTGSCKVFVVDPTTRTPEILFSPNETEIGECRNGQFPTMALFEESLTSVGRTSEETIFSSPSAQAWSEVFTWLPATVVGRLNQVCKDWRAIIKSECFVQAHLHRANLNRSPQIMFANGKPYGFESLEKCVNALMLPPLIDDDDGSSQLVCSNPCHGLIAGSSMCGYDFVCNPVTDYYKALPLDRDTELRGIDIILARSRRLYCSSTGSEAMFAGRFGLGYDPEMDAHVLVRLVYKERNLITRGYRLECMIRYVQDTYWEMVDPPPRPVANMPPVSAHGKLYWVVDAALGQRSLFGGYELVALDVSTREFEVLQGPPCGGHDNDDDDKRRVSIVELQGVICMACLRRGSGTIDIWAMQPGTCSWSLEHCIKLRRFSPEYSAQLVTPVAIDSKTGRILLSTGRALGYYDPTTAKIQTIYRLRRHITGKKFVPVLFQESLVNPCDRIL